ncbi:MAG TPA: hypothetical protein VGE76_04505, partial [Opitutaceae bacterium]
SLDHTVRYFALAPSIALWPGFAPAEAEFLARGNLLQRASRSHALAARVRAWGPDAIYFRYAYHSAGYPELFRDIPAIAEINSDDLREYPLTLSRAKVLYHRLTRARVLAACRGFVPVTHEIGARFAEFAKPILVIGNGIALADFASAPLPPEDALPRLIFVGTAGAPWHGLERIAELARLFPDMAVEVVGYTRADWVQIAPSAGNPPPTLTFHGPLGRTQYAALLSRATAAIGSMALFKNSMDEACPLKVREYLACGLPVLAAYTDTDIPESADYFLRLPNDAASLTPHRERIAAWLGQWRARRVPRSAIAHLDVTVKEKARLDFMASLAHGGAPT